MHPNKFDEIIARKTMISNQNDKTFQTTTMDSSRLSFRPDDGSKSRRVTFDSDISMTNISRMMNIFSTMPAKNVDIKMPFSVLPRGGDDPSIQMAVIKNSPSTHLSTTPSRSSPPSCPPRSPLSPPPGCFFVSRSRHFQNRLFDGPVQALFWDHQNPSVFQPCLFPLSSSSSSSSPPPSSAFPPMNPPFGVKRKRLDPLPEDGRREDAQEVSQDDRRRDDERADDVDRQAHDVSQDEGVTKRDDVDDDVQDEDGEDPLSSSVNRTTPEISGLSKAELDAHLPHHHPYRAWCEHCVRAKGRIGSHRLSGDDRLPGCNIMHLDFAFLKRRSDDVDENELMPILVIKDGYH